MLNGKQLVSQLHITQHRHRTTCQAYEYVRLLSYMAAGPIDDHMSNLIIAQLMYLESENPETPVSLLIQQTPS